MRAKANVSQSPPRISDRDRQKGGRGRLRPSEKLIKKISDQQPRPVRVQSHS